MRKKLPATFAALVLAATGSLGGTLAAAGPASAAAPLVQRTVPAVPAPPAVSLRKRADRLMNLTYRQFARAPRVAPFNWTTDGCSVPAGLTPYREVFRPACVQHDFGYRNYGANHRLKLSPTRETKNWIDSRFRTEMGRICDDTSTTPSRRRACVNAADTFYLGVTIGGDRAFF